MEKIDIKKSIGTFITMVLLIWLIAQISPSFTDKYKKVPAFAQEFVMGKVLSVEQNDLVRDPYVEGRYNGSQKYTVLIQEGSQEGNEFTVYNTLSSLKSAYAYEGLEAVFTVRTSTDGKISVWLYNYRRDKALYALAMVLIILVILIGKNEGINSLLALAFTAAVIVYIVVPMMWSPHPILIAIISSIIICLVSFLLIAGWTRKAIVASIGTLLGISLAGVICYSFGRLQDLSGVDMTKGESLLYLAQDSNFKIKSLLFVSILISSLGATMDIAMSIASSGTQIVRTKPDIANKELFVALINVGKDIIGTMTNTLILSFCGASLPLAMLIWGYDMSYMQFINIPIIVIDILQALSGSIGMVTSVIFTAVAFVALPKRKGVI
ncbi:MAG: YibE/F family protein [Sphaerochaeta sp.]